MTKEKWTQSCSIKSVFKNCAKLTGKSICRNLRQRYFPANFVQLLRTPTLWRVVSEYEWHNDLSITVVLDWWCTALWSISVCMRRVWKEHLGRRICTEPLLVSKSLFQLNTKKKLHFIEVIAKPKNLLQKYIQTEKLRNCIYLLLLVYNIGVK